jgi:hypothetical protein
MKKDFICETQGEFTRELTGALEKAAVKRKMGFFENSKFDVLGGTKILSATWELYDEFDPAHRAIVITKFQNTSGTTEEKLPFEVIRCLEFLDRDRRFNKVWILLGGFGWNLNFIEFIEKRLEHWVPEMAGKVEIVVRKNEFQRLDFSDF